MKQRLWNLTRIGARSWPWRRAWGSITADPNPLSVQDARGLGSTTLSWISRHTELVEVRVGAPDGPLVSRTGPCGQVTVGPWVCAGMRFFLQNVSGGIPLTPQGTLDVVQIRVPGAGRQQAPRRLLDRLFGDLVHRRLEEFHRRNNEPPAVGKVSFGSLRRLTPVSNHFGFERGLPIDRFYVEAFLADCAQDVQGVVLEIGDNPYTLRFGSGRVTKSDVLNLEDTPAATIVADLTSADHLPSDYYDCIILTQTLQYIYDFRAAVRTLHRLLRPGGVLLATFPGITHTADDPSEAPRGWSFTPFSARRLFTEYFPAAAVQVRSFGNVLAAASFLYGLAAGELTKDELDYHHPGYDLVIAVRAVKPPDHEPAETRSSGS
jgi:SAM-dependent methyltransferase